MMKKEKIIAILGISLILIAIFNFLWKIATLIIFAIMKGDFKIIQQMMQIPGFNFFFIGGRYMGISMFLKKLHHAIPIWQAKYLSVMIDFITFYVPLLCKIIILICGFGLFSRKEIYRKTAIITLSTVLSLSIVNYILLNLTGRFFAVEILVGLIFVGIVIYYLTRPKVKEMFR
jgi:hypothetical protein